MNGSDESGAPRRSGGQPARSWAEVQAPHPGVRDPRSLRMGDWPPLVNAAIIATCAFLTALAVLSAAIASPVGDVERWSQWRGAGGSLQLEHPAGWAVHDLGSAEQTHLVILRSPWVRVHVISETGLANAAGLYRQIGSGANRYRALEMLHDSTGQTWERQIFGRLEEGPAGRTSIGGRRAVWSQFRYVGENLEDGEAMTGYRATIMGENRGVIAGAVAPSDNWDEFKPIALRLLRSIRFGQAAG
jgi:hypothetical protein